MPLDRLARRFLDDGLAWGLVNLAGRAHAALRSAFARAALRAPGLHLGGPATIRGARRIRFGRGVHVGGRIWLEAVVRYGEQRFEPLIELGDGCAFSEGVHITAIERVSIGRGVLFGSHVYVGDHAHGVYRGTAQSRPDLPAPLRPLGGGGPVTVGDNAWIGDNVVILGPATIGAGAVVGANSVVRGDVAPGTIVAGAPARPIKAFDEASSSWIRKR